MKLRFDFLFLSIFFYFSTGLAFEIVAHRGGPQGLFKDSSLEAFNHSIQNGHFFLESDLHLTSDRSVVLIHDPVVTALDGKIHKVKNTTLEKLNQIQPMASLVDVADLIKKFPNVIFHLEIKYLNVWEKDSDLYFDREQTVDVIVRQILDLKIQDSVLISSFDFKILQLVRQRSTQMKVKLLYRGEYFGHWLGNPSICLQFCFWPLWDDVLLQISELSAEAFSPSYRLYTHPVLKFLATPPALLKKSYLESRSFQIYIWTVNDTGTLESLKDMAFDGIITDYPNLFRK